MPANTKPLLVAGIDVGGMRKGFHGVALHDGVYLEHHSSKDLATVLGWCREQVQARVIGIDAPCRWSADGRSRPAERELMGNGIWCFSTPTRAIAHNHRSNYFGWMRQGEKLFQALETTHRLCGKMPLLAGKISCFETFPHAIACALAGRVLFAKEKRRDRKALLRQEGIDTAPLSNIDLVDAALCALTAHWIVSGMPVQCYGNQATGQIIVPRKS